MRARPIATALMLCAAATTASIALPATAMASTASVSCYSTGWANSGHTLLDYECDLSATYAANEHWSGIQVNAASQGTATATGTCKTVTQTYAYYPSVKYAYDAQGDTTTTSARAFLCGDEF
ncbi:MAG TPA: hypothetical protein VGX23_28370 [Actinocrinis sp.]|nr:hypothetical protein [Actinocrinis sp.]